MIHISRSLVGAAELEAMDRVVRQDGYLGMGREVRAFEAELQDYLGGQDRTVICLNSGTAALHLAVAALTSPGDEVLCTADLSPHSGHQAGARCRWPAKSARTRYLDLRMPPEN
jgi:dTDP-4-amino-4,6-dideoxygalactose transaminase